MPREVGQYERTAIAGQTVSAFIPDPLPPTNPPLSLDETTRALLRSAEQKLSKLDLAAEMVPLGIVTGRSKSVGPIGG